MVLKQNWALWACELTLKLLYHNTCSMKPVWNLPQWAYRGESIFLLWQTLQYLDFIAVWLKYNRYFVAVWLYCKQKAAPAFLMCLVVLVPASLVLEVFGKMRACRCYVLWGDVLWHTWMNKSRKSRLDMCTPLLARLNNLIRPLFYLKSCVRQMYFNNLSCVTHRTLTR